MTHVKLNNTGNNSCQITLGARPDLVRFSYLQAFKPRAKRDPNTNELVLDEDGNKIMEYSVQVQIPKAAKDVVADAKEAIESVGKEFHGDKWELVKKNPKANWQLRDGDLEAELKDNEDTKGFWLVNARTTRKPDVVGGRKNEDGKFVRLNAGDVKSGDWGRIGVSFYGYKKGGGIGVACALNTIQFLQEGKALGNGRAAEDDFDEDEDTGSDSVL